MLNPDFRNPQQIGAAVLLTAAVGALAYFVLRRKPVQPEELERLRREYLSHEGRIIDGMVMDAVTKEGMRGDGTPYDGSSGESSEGSGDAMQMILYRYEIAGVMYESSQDVTHLAEYIDLDNCRVDLPASIRYQVGNPANSIVVSETWNGLQSGSIRRMFPPKENMRARSGAQTL